MRRQRTSWFQGWKITLRCIEFNRQDGSKRFVSAATFQHIPTPSGDTSLHRLDVLARSKVHSEEAFCSCEEAEADAIERAKLEISELAGTLDFDGNEVMEYSLCDSACSESDESLASRFEITFDGSRYAFRQYRYDLFQDALRYAMAEHAKKGFLRNEAFYPSWKAKFHPSAEDERTMKLHGIAYFNGRYLYGGYQYGQLSDAVAFAMGHPNL